MSNFKNNVTDKTFLQQNLDGKLLKVYKKVLWT